MIVLRPDLSDEDRCADWQHARAAGAEMLVCKSEHIQASQQRGAGCLRAIVINRALSLPGSLVCPSALTAAETEAALLCRHRDVELAKFEAFLSKEGGANVNAMVRGRQRLAYPIKK